MACEEADTKAFCDTETSKSKAKQADLTAKSDKSQVRIEKATAAIAELKTQIKTLQEQTAEMDAAQAEATSIRNKESEEFLKSSKTTRTRQTRSRTPSRCSRSTIALGRSSSRRRNRSLAGPRRTSPRPSWACWKSRSRTSPPSSLRRRRPRKPRKPPTTSSRSRTKSQRRRTPRKSRTRRPT